MVDKARIRQRVQYVEENLKKLGFLSGMPYEEFASDFRNIETAKHLLQISIEAMLDMSNHIIARNRWGLPTTSAESLRILRENGYYTQEEEELFARMVKFRNRVVHLYHNVDDGEVYRILRENLPDFLPFLKAVALKHLL